MRRHIEEHFRNMFADFTYMRELYSTLEITIKDRFEFLETAVSFIDKPDIKENIIHKAANHAAAYCCDLVDLIKHVVKNINVWEIRENQTLPSACSEMLGKEDTSAVENKACIFAICFLLVYDCTHGEFK